VIHDNEQQIIKVIKHITILKMQNDIMT